MTDRFSWCVVEAIRIAALGGFFAFMFVLMALLSPERLPS